MCLLTVIPHWSAVHEKKVICCLAVKTLIESMDTFIHTASAHASSLARTDLETRIELLSSSILSPPYLLLDGNIYGHHNSWNVGSCVTATFRRGKRLAHKSNSIFFWSIDGLTLQETYEAPFVK